MCTVSTPHNYVDSRELLISLSILILAFHQLVTPQRLTPTKKPASQQKSIVLKKTTISLVDFERWDGRRLAMNRTEH